MSTRGAEGQPCTAEVNPLWPHRYEQDAEGASNPAFTPGYDTCGLTEGGHAAYTPERIRDAEWGQACYQRAAENDVRRNIPLNVGLAAQELVDEAHAEALGLDAAREHLRWENDRRAQLNQQAREGRNSADPATRAAWLARDEAWTRQTAPAHDTDGF